MNAEDPKVSLGELGGVLVAPNALELLLSH